MNLYSVHVDRDRLDGPLREGSPTSGEITRMVYRYAATSFAQVYERHLEVLMEGHDTIVAITQDAAGVEVLPDSGRGE